MAPLLIVAVFEREVSCYANRLQGVTAVPGGGLAHPGVELGWMEIKRRQA